MALPLVAAVMMMQVGAAAPREPIFIVNPARKATWTRMRNEGHHLYRLASSNCAVTGTAQQRYGDSGVWCAWLYQATGDRLAARRAIGLLTRIGDSPANGNAVREYFLEHVIITDWLWNAMDERERAIVVAKLDGWARFATGRTGKKYLGGFRTFDSDQSVSTYFALAAFDRLNRSLRRPGEWLDSVSTPQAGQRVPIGGLAASGANRETARNNVEFYVQRATGGEWHESESYNQGTLPLMLMGVEALRTALGRDAFPTVTAFFRDAAIRETFAVTPDLLQGVQWGDEEHPRGFLGRLFRRVTLLGMLQGATGNPATHRLLLDIWARHGVAGRNSGEPNARILMLYDPYAPVADRVPAGGYLARGRGHLYVKTPSTLFFAEASNPSAEDHDVKYLSNMALYRNGAWVLDHPLGYGGAANGAYATNGVSYAGFGAMVTRGMTRADSGEGWWSITGVTSGPAYRDYYDPPPVFLQHATRTTWYTEVGSWSVIVTRDSVVMKDPRTLPKFARYRKEHEWQLAQAGGRWETVWHAAVVPRMLDDGYSWPAPNGETVIVMPFGPAITSNVLDERALWPKPARGRAPVNEATRRHQLRIRTTGDVMWTVVLAGRGTPPGVRRTAHGVAVGPREIAMNRGLPLVR